MQTFAVRLIVLVLLLASATSYAVQIQNKQAAYYGGKLYAELEQGRLRNQSLVQELNRSIAQQKVLTYSEARRALLGKLHLEAEAKGYVIHDAYCDKDFSEHDFPAGKGIGPDRTPDDKILNVEHTWPQSRFSRQFPKEVQKSDLHHLFPSDSELNSNRGNYKFGMVQGKSFDLKCHTSRLGFASKGGGHVFEPPHNHKGNVARALFYFSTRYKINIDADEEAVLRQWHNIDPVDEEERERNDEIFSIQGNRNPYIDHPEMVDLVSDF